MVDLKSRQEKIQEKHKVTPRREFLLTITSWRPAMFYRTQGEMSRYPQTQRIGTLISNEEFGKNRDSLLHYGQEVHTDKSFFEQFQELFHSIPLGATIRQMAGENSMYADSVVESSNSYLSSVVINDCSNILYSFIVFDYCKDVFNSSRIGTHSERIYNSVAVVQSSQIFYSRYITNSSNIRFSTNMIGCSECLLCDGLENQSYCIENQQLTKQEYTTKKALLLADKTVFSERFSKLNTRSLNYGSTGSSWNHTLFCTGVENGLFVNRLENGRNVVCIGGENQEKNFFDAFDGGVNSYDMYGIEGCGSGSNNVYCSTQIEHCSQVFYSYYLVNCSYCLGCIWLQNKQFCILNKQYTKDERHAKVDQIFSQMEHEGALWSFFPGQMNPYYFNDTAAYLIDPTFTKEEVTAAWYLRRDEPIKVDIPDRMETVKTSELDQYESRDEHWAWNIDPSILKKVIIDEKWDSYRIVKMEYDFLVKHGLPLPRQHRLDRMKQNFKIS